MKKLLFLILPFVALTAAALAASPFDISYPIADLGNCGSQQECKAYCDDSTNQEQCQLWAEDNGFAPKKKTPVSGTRDREREKIDGEALANAPGGCVSPRECDAYCRIEENLNECLDYSVKYGYTTQEEADKIRAQAARGGPGGCKSETECDTYCRNPQNARECMAFVVEEGKITQEEADFMVEQMSKPGGPGGKPTGKGPAEPKIKEEKVLKALKTESGPGGCKDMKECAAYCMGGEHMEECMAFATKHGIMEPVEMEKVKKLSQMGGPGGCKNAQECDAFCGEPGNGEICFQFAKDNGLMSDEEIQMMDKQMSVIKKLDRQVGPGGCRSKEECSAYCNDPSKIEECINFAGKTGMMNPGAVKNMMGQTQEAKDKLQDLERYRAERAMDEGEGAGGFFGNFFGGNKPSKGARPPMGQPGQQIPPGGLVPPNGMMQGPPPGVMNSGGQEQQLPPWGTYGPPPEGWMPPVGGMPPSGTMTNPPAGYEGQMPPEGFVPPTNYQYGPPPGGSGGIYGPPPGYEGQMPPQGMPPPTNMMPPPGTQFSPPPSGEIMPSQPSTFRILEMLGASAYSIFDLLKPFER